MPNTFNLVAYYNYSIGQGQYWEVFTKPKKNKSKPSHMLTKEVFSVFLNENFDLKRTDERDDRYNGQKHLVQKTNTRCACQSCLNL